MTKTKKPANEDAVAKASVPAAVLGQRLERRAAPGLGRSPSPGRGEHGEGGDGGEHARRTPLTRAGAGAASAAARRG